MGNNSTTTDCINLLSEYVYTEMIDVPIRREQTYSDVDKTQLLI